MNKVVYEMWSKSPHFDIRDNLGFAEHLHDNIEITVIAETEENENVTAMVEGVTYVLKKGDVFFTFPNQTHSYGYARCKAYITIFDSDVLRFYGEKFNGCFPATPVIHDDELAEKLIRYFDEGVRIAKGSGQYTAEKLYAIAMLILGFVLEKTGIRESKKIRTNGATDIFAYCNENFLSDIDLDVLSKKVGVSKSHIVRIFREKFNTTFNRYITSLRIGEAKKLLNTTNKTVTEIAATVGYNTIRSFNRAFLSAEGLSPSEYREKNKINKKVK